MTPSSFPKNSQYNNKLILVFGAAGVTGQAVSRLLLKTTSRIVLLDSDTNRPLHPALGIGIQSKQIVDARGKKPQDLLKEYNIDLIINSPGIPWEHELFIEARRLGIDFECEMDLVYKIINELSEIKSHLFPAIVAITGTDGKSTTTWLLSEMINHSTNYHGIATGNYGFPFSLLALAMIGEESEVLLENEKEIFQTIHKNKDKIIAIVENSSFQLERIKHYKPDISIILNIAEDHLDRYDTMDGYLKAKLNINCHQDSGDMFLAPERINDWIRENAMTVRATQWTLPTIDELIQKKEISYNQQSILNAAAFTGYRSHNRINLEAALMALAGLERKFALDVSIEKLADYIKNFKGLAHRFEFVRSISGIEFINDSKATTVQSVLGAVASLADKKIYLLLGGKSKKTDFSPLAKLGEQYDLEFFIYGECRDELQRLLCAPLTYHNLEDAFRAAWNVVKTTDPLESDQKKSKVILLSPGCASYDLYANFMERGDHFKSLVGSL